MSDFIDRLGTELLRAANAGPHPAPSRLFSWRRWHLGRVRPRLLLVAPALAVLGTAGALASGILATGAPVVPKVPPSPTADEGAAVPSTATLLPLHAADPSGGLAWGLRAVRTTRADVCLQVGRLDGRAIGALGEDGSFGNDHRFHPLSVQYLSSMACAPLDAHGHGFTSVALWGLPASAIAADPARPTPGCRDGARLAPCARADTRDVYLGLLGPDATSITYVAGDGRDVTVPTAGPDGAYLIVTRAQSGQQQGSSMEYVGLLRAGPIRSVTYTDGHTCRPTAVYPCAPVGLVAATAPRVSEAELASPIHVREVRARSFCVRGLGFLDAVIQPCPALVPRGFTRQTATPATLLIVVSYTARTAVRSDSSFYYTSLFFPSIRTCHEYATSSATSRNVRAGERVTVDQLVLASCHGTVHGIVRYHPATAAPSSAPEPDPVDPGSITVGRFSFRIP